MGVLLQYRHVLSRLDELLELNIEWLADFTRHNKCKEVLLGSTYCTDKKVVSICGEVWRNNELIHWNGYDANHNQSKLTVLDLTENPWQRIIGL